MNTTRKLSLAAAAAALACASLGAQAATCPGGNLVTNCGFEAGNFSGWTLSGIDVDAGTEGNLYGVEGADPFGPGPHGGNSQAYFADQVANTTTLSQSIATTAGTSYTVSFWLAEATDGPGTNNNRLTATFGGASLTPLTNVTDQGYTEYTFSGLASAGSTQLSFTFGNDVGQFQIDDVSVLGPAAPPPPPPPAIPEPSTLSLLGLGALMLAVRRQAHKKD